MRTPTIVCLSALASAAIAVPTALVAHDTLESLHLGSTSVFGQRSQPEQTLPSTPGQGSAGQGNTPATQRSAGSGTVTQADAKQSHGVVMIDTVTPSGEGAGSGMVLTSDGTVLTNYHVVDGSTQIRVILPHGQRYTADVVGHDQTHDLAVLKLRGASGLSTVSLDTDGVKTSESVLAVGQGNGEGVLYTAKGSVTSTNARVTASDDSALASSESLTGLIQTNAPIVPGYSGGPLFDASGRVVGVDTAASSNNSLTGYSGAQSSSDIEGFAIPITQAKPIVDDILAGKKTTTNHIGARAALGIQVIPTRQGAPSNGVTVQGVVAGQGAASTGISAGDTITSIGGHSITDSTDLSRVMDQQKPGATVVVTWMDYSGAKHSASVRLTKSPAN